MVAGVALRAGQWVIVTGAGLTAKALSQVGVGINAGIEVTLVVIVVVAAFALAYDAWRLYRPRPDATQSP